MPLSVSGDIAGAAQAAWVGVLVASGVLAVSGATKLRHPDTVVPLLAILRVPRLLQRGRLVGCAELILGVGAGVTSYSPLLMAEGGIYLLFALIIAYVLVARVPLASCGCSGSGQTPPNVLHVAVNVTAASAALTAASLGAPSLRRMWPELFWAGIPVAAGAAAAIALTLVVMGPLAELLQACVRVRAAGLVYQPPSRSEMVA
jgi:hypothetical protein